MILRARAPALIDDDDDDVAADLSAPGTSRNVRPMAVVELFGYPELVCADSIYGVAPADALKQEVIEIVLRFCL